MENHALTCLPVYLFTYLPVYLFTGSPVYLSTRILVPQAAL